MNKIIWTQADSDRMSSLKYAPDDEITAEQREELASLKEKWRAVLRQDEAQARSRLEAERGGTVESRSVAAVLNDMSGDINGLRDQLSNAMNVAVRQHRINRISSIMIEVNRLLHRAVGQSWRVALDVEMARKDRPAPPPAPKKRSKAEKRMRREMRALFMDELKRASALAFEARDSITMRELIAAMRHHALDAPDKLAVAFFDHAAQRRRSVEG